MISLPIITIKCGAADCTKGRHAYNDRDYKRLGQGRQYLQAGICKCCGDGSVDFKRTHARNANDVEYLVSALPLENIRHDFWTRPFNDVSLARARALGRAGISAEIRTELARTVGPVAEAGWAYKMVPTAQDKMTDVIQYAQHAMAACCRRCICEWHGIPNEKPLTNEQTGYLAFLVERYLDERLAKIILQ